MYIRELLVIALLSSGEEYSSIRVQNTGTCIEPVYTNNFYTCKRWSYLKIHIIIKLTPYKVIVD